MHSVKAGAHNSGDSKQEVPRVIHGLENDMRVGILRSVPSKGPFRLTSWKSFLFPHMWSVIPPWSPVLIHHITLTTLNCH